MNKYSSCYPGTPLWFEVDLKASCNKNGVTVSIYAWGDQSSMTREIRRSSNWIGSATSEVSWAGGTDYIYDATGVYYQVIRCYADAPVCIETWSDTKEQAEAVLGELTYLDATGIEALNNLLARWGV